MSILQRPHNTGNNHLNALVHGADGKSVEIITKIREWVGYTPGRLTGFATDARMG